jgi:hypothetical protein
VAKTHTLSGNQALVGTTVANLTMLKRNDLAHCTLKMLQITAKFEHILSYISQIYGAGLKQPVSE